jgi:hypothetical protein
VQGQREVTILFDSGIPTVSEQEIYLWMFGSSLATAFFLGRSGELLSCYGLSLGGEQGVEEALRALRADTEITLELSGYRNFVVALRHHQCVLRYKKGYRISCQVDQAPVRLIPTTVSPALVLPSKHEMLYRPLVFDIFSRSM